MIGETSRTWWDCTKPASLECPCDKCREWRHAQGFAAPYPDGNPKTAIGATKVPLHLAPPSAMHYLALAFKDGAAKYGPYNWRDQGVSATVYYAAAMRHLAAWLDGEDLSPDAQVHHLAHVMACCAIVLDAQSVGKLNDDRPTKGASATLHAAFACTREGPRGRKPEDLTFNPVNQRDEE